MGYNLFQHYEINEKIEFAQKFRSFDHKKQFEWVNKNFIIGDLYTYDIDLRLNSHYKNTFCLYVTDENGNNKMAEFKENPVLLFIGIGINNKMGYNTLNFFYNNANHHLNICEAWLFKRVK